MKSITMNVQGMSCGHCVKAVEGAVGELDGIQTVQVKLEEGSVQVTYDEALTSNQKIEEAIEDQGYDVA